MHIYDVFDFFSYFIIFYVIIIYRLIDKLVIETLLIACKII